MTCALHEDGRGFCWGGNALCMLGDGTMVASRATPTPVPGLSNARQVALGFYHACAVLSGNEVRCWGTNNGSIADAAMVRPCTMGTSVYNGVSPPTMLRGLTATNVDEVRHMGEFSCVRTGPRTVQCWGNGDYGQLGDNNGHMPPGMRMQATPTPVSGICSG